MKSSSDNAVYSNFEKVLSYMELKSACLLDPTENKPCLHKTRSQREKCKTVCPFQARHLQFFFNGMSFDITLGILIAFLGDTPVTQCLLLNCGLQNEAMLQRWSDLDAERVF